MTGRKRDPLRELQRDLYLSQRTIGDVRAAQRGPNILAKRVIRRHITRWLLRGLR